MKRRIQIVRLLGELVRNYDSGHRARHVAAVVKKNKIVSIGFNSLKTSPRVLQYTRTHARVCIHAEVDAIHRAHTTEGLDLFVVRVDANGLFAQSKPCVDCQRAIDKSGIKRVIYTTNDGIEVAKASELDGYIRAARVTEKNNVYI